MKQIPEDLCLNMRKELSLFNFLSKDDVVDLACYFELKKATAGEVLWREEDVCDYVGFIASGRLEIKKETEFKGKQVMLGVYSKGAIVGELCILDGHPRVVTAVALEDVTLVLLTRENFEKLLEEHPALGIKFLKGMLLSMSLRLRKSFDRLVATF